MIKSIRNFKIISEGLFSLKEEENGRLQKWGKNKHELHCLFLMLPFMLLHDALGVLGNCDVLRCLLGHHSIELKMLRFKRA